MAKFKIFVGNINKTTSAERLRTLFEKFGKVDDVALAEDKQTGKRRGFAFVFMESSDAGELAIATLNHHKLDGFRLAVAAGDKKHKPTAKQQQVKTPDRPRRRRRLHGRGASRAGSDQIRVYRPSNDRPAPF